MKRIKCDAEVSILDDPPPPCHHLSALAGPLPLPPFYADVIFAQPLQLFFFKQFRDIYISINWIIGIFAGNIGSFCSAKYRSFFPKYRNILQFKKKKYQNIIIDIYSKQKGVLFKRHFTGNIGHFLQKFFIIKFEIIMIFFFKRKI